MMPFTILVNVIFTLVFIFFTLCESDVAEMVILAPHSRLILVFLLFISLICFCLQIVPCRCRVCHLDFFLAQEMWALHLFLLVFMINCWWWEGILAAIQPVISLKNIFCTDKRGRLRIVLSLSRLALLRTQLVLLLDQFALLIKSIRLMRCLWFLLLS